MILSKNSKLFTIIHLVVLILLFDSKRSWAQQFSCDPNVDCVDAAPGDKVPDPNSCNQYYLCVTDGSDVFPSDEPIACSVGFYFDFTAGDCRSENGTVCIDQCVNMCTDFCSDAGVTVVIPGDCVNYRFCSGFNESVLVPCDPGLYYNGSICQSDPNQCCDNCTPYCEIEFTQTRNPRDCTQYYLCTSVGVPGASDLYTCPTGQYFNSDSARCEDLPDPLTPCTSYCPSAR